jgi:hypothetical protein
LGIDAPHLVGPRSDLRGGRGAIGEWTSYGSFNDDEKKEYKLELEELEDFMLS